MKESNLTKLILLKIASIRGLRVFRNNVGTAWTGKVIQRSKNFITLADPRPLSSGLCKGSSDYIGWKTVEITPEMVGTKVAVFVGLEFKVDSGRASKDQINFIKQVREAGGFAGIVKKEQDAEGLLK